MTFYTDLFSPETYTAFSESDRSVSGFKFSQRGTAVQIRKGDKLICYVTRLSRWVGILEVTESFFEDSTPIFVSQNDPYTVRFRVKPTIWLPLEQGIPISDSHVWKTLSFTRELIPDSLAWTGMVRSSLRKLTESDGFFLNELLTRQQLEGKLYPFSSEEQRILRRLTVRNQESQEVAVSIPDDESDGSTASPNVLPRESFEIQALLSKIGERMGFKIWLPKNDRSRVIEVWRPEEGILLNSLPLNYDLVTLGTIENIDVLWIKGRSIVRAFEVEHTTSIHSGILRMADLMALQPNLSIQAHIVAPIERREKVFQEITRPVFALLEKGPLEKSCTFLSYQSIRELARERRLEHMSDSVLDDFEETAG